LHALSASTRTIKWTFERRDVKKTQLSIYLDPETFGGLEAELSPIFGDGRAGQAAAVAG
jgi:hypothetical protein